MNSKKHRLILIQRNTKIEFAARLVIASNLNCVEIRMSLNEKKILLVEDHPDTMEMVQRQLEHIGFGTVLTAWSAYSALKIAEAEKPDLILMDIVLPGMSGLEATRRLKVNPITCTIPVLATTARAMPGDKELCLQNGCDGYLPKPISWQQLKQAIEELISPRPRAQ